MDSPRSNGPRVNAWVTFSTNSFSVVDKQTAREAWCVFETFYVNFRDPVQQLRSHLQTGSPTIHECVYTTKSLALALASAGEDVDDDDFVLWTMSLGDRNLIWLLLQSTLTSDSILLRGLCSSSRFWAAPQLFFSATIFRGLLGCSCILFWATCVIHFADIKQYLPPTILQLGVVLVVVVAPELVAIAIVAALVAMVHPWQLPPLQMSPTSNRCGHPYREANTIPPKPSMLWISLIHLIELGMLLLVLQPHDAFRVWHLW